MVPALVHNFFTSQPGVVNKNPASMVAARVPCKFCPVPYKLSEQLQEGPRGENNKTTSFACSQYYFQDKIESCLLFIKLFRQVSHFILHFVFDTITRTYTYISLSQLTHRCLIKQSICRERKFATVFRGNRKDDLVG